MCKFLKYLFLVLSGIPVLCLSQERAVIHQPKEKWADQSGEIKFPSGHISNSPDEAGWQEAARVFTAQSLGLAPTDLVEEHYNTSPIGRHISFAQTWKGIPVFCG